jgi:hypothetical protein
MGSANSNIVPVTVAPASFTLTMAKSNHVQGGHLFNDNELFWSGPIASCVNFQVWLQLNGGGFSLLATQAASGTPYSPSISYTDSGLASTWTYGERDYYVVALDAGNNVLATSNTATLIWFESTLTIVSADNSSSPTGGDGEGFYDAVLSPSHACGSITSNAFAGSVCHGIWFDQNSGVNDIFFVIAGSFPQDLFNQLSFIDKHAVTENYLTSAATFSTTLFPGFTSWQWPAILNFPFTNGGTYVMTFT